MVAFRHSAVLLSGVVSRARGTRMAVAPKVPFKPRSRWPRREPTAPIGELTPPIRGRSYRSRPSTVSNSASRSSSMKPRMRARTPVSRGSNQSSQKNVLLRRNRSLTLCYPLSWRDLRRRANADSVCFHELEITSFTDYARHSQTLPRTELGPWTRSPRSRGNSYA